MQSKIIETSLPRRERVSRHPASSACRRADALLSDTGCISYFFLISSKTPSVCITIACKFTPGVEKCHHSFAKDAIIKNMWLKSAGIRWCQHKYS